MKPSMDPFDRKR